MVVLATALFAFALQASEAQVSPGSLRPGTTETTRIVVVAVTAFLHEWELAWRASEGDRHTINYFKTNEPLPRGWGLFHCHTRDEKGWLSAVNPYKGSGINSHWGTNAACPAWLVSRNDEGNLDERVRLDLALTPRRSDAIVAARARLVSLLDTAVRRAPQDAWLVGQLVRFLVDQGDARGALAAVRECRASRWWCAALAGFALAYDGSFVEADSAFHIVTDLLPLDARCEWTDTRVLLDSVPRQAYVHLSCAGRDSVNARLWWLADPMLSEKGNARRVENYVRRVLLLLRGGLTRDERYDWRDSLGGDARREMVLRYGWPTYVFWAGFSGDSSHLDYTNRWKIPFSPPYTTFEYSRGRQHLVPAWRALLDPFHSAASAWVINEPPPPPKPDLPPQLIPPWYWWPAEHYAAQTPIVQLPEGQVALLRRANNTLLAAAVDLSPEITGRRIKQTITNATLVVSPEPDVVVRVATGSGVVGAPLVLSGLVDAQPAVIGIEFPASSTGLPAGRSRLGITPPPPLIVMAPGEMAVSDPVLLKAGSVDEVLPNDPDVALLRMAGSTVVQNVGRLGVYWETYGIKPTDSVDVAVWIERYTPQGFVRRFAARLDLVPDLNTPVVMSWSESESGHNAHVLAGPQPIIARAVSLDVSKLPKGDYWLDLVVRKPGNEPMRGRRSFTIK